MFVVFFFQAEDGIRDRDVTGVQTCALPISFEDRVKAQEAIERVYYSHQIGTTKPFEEAVPHELLVRKVRTRSEEHTSELQSHHDLVCRLLLEKKKKKKKQPKKKKTKKL